MGTSSRGGSGLEGVLVGRSAISWVGGETGELAYRGYDVRELVPGVPYESIAHLLLFGEPPASDPSPEVVRALRAVPPVPELVQRAVDGLPVDRTPLEALGAILPLLGEPGTTYPPRLEQGFRLIRRMPELLARFVRRASGQVPVPPRDDLSHAANYLWMLRGELPAPRAVNALEGYLDLLADHGMNASTFALRIAISTESDFFSAASAALATLKGAVHGGAPSRVTEMLDAIGTPDRAEAWIRDRMARKEVVYGLGHRVYKTEDPRGLALHAIARTVAHPDRLALAEAVEETALRLLRGAHPRARLFTNVEYYSAVVMEAVGLPPSLFTPTFAVARSVGWTAQALEQAADNRLIRPDVEYTGPPPNRRWPRPVPGR